MAEFKNQDEGAETPEEGTPEKETPEGEKTEV